MLTPASAILVLETFSEVFFLHGSKNKLECVEPHQANDESGDPLCCLNAVYATDNISIAAVMAMLQRKDPGLPSHCEYHTTESGLVVSGRNVAFRTGWVHALDRDTFEVRQSATSREIVSLVGVTPAFTLEVSPAIIPLLPITLKFDYDPFAT